MDRRPGFLNTPETTRLAIVSLLIAFAATATLRFAGIATAHTGRMTLALLALAGLVIAYHLIRFQKALFAFLVRRLALMIVTLIGITLVTFIIIRAAPGDPVSQSTAPGSMGQGVDPAQMAREVQKSQRELLGIAQQYEFEATAEDPENDEVQLIFDWGDGSTITRSRFVASGTKVGVEHAWGQEGTYRVRCQAVDKHGNRSAWSDFALIEIREKNLPPAKPKVVEAPAEITALEKPLVKVVSTDPEGKRLTYQVFFTGPALLPDEKEFKKAEGGSGETAEVTLDNTGASGEFWIHVRAQDERGAASDWADPVRVVVVKDRNPLLRPDLLDLPPYWAVGKDLRVRVRAPEKGPKCRVQVEFGEGQDRTTWMSDPVEPGTTVEATGKAPRLPEDKKGFRVRTRAVDASSASRTSDWRVGRVLMHESSLPPRVPAKPAGPAKGILTRPYWLQYLTWLKRCATLDFGKSSAYNDDVIKMRRWKGIPIGLEGNGGVLPERLLRTLKVEAIALLLIYLIAVPIGIYSSTHQRSVPDKVITFCLFVLYSLPSFWVGTMLIVLVTGFKGIPFVGLGCSEQHRHPFLGKELDFFWHALLPVVCLTYGGLAALSRYARSGMLEVVRQDYIRTARAKGLSEKVVIFKHALRNGMIPILTLLANLLPYLIGGAVIIEFIFSIEGMGLLAFEAITRRDYNVVMAVTTLSAVMTLAGILISDILYVLVDPRISFESMEGS